MESCYVRVYTTLWLYHLNVAPETETLCTRRYFFFIIPLIVNDNAHRSAVPEILKPAHVVWTMPQSHFSSRSSLLWTSAGRFHLAHMPTCIELLLSDWLIQATEQMYLTKWPVNTLKVSFILYEHFHRCRYLVNYGKPPLAESSDYKIGFYHIMCHSDHKMKTM